MTRAKVSKEDKAVSVQKQGVRLDGYSLSKNGMFDPVCPIGYNFLTGMIDWRTDMQMQVIPPHSKCGMLNGKPVHNF